MPLQAQGNGANEHGPLTSRFKVKRSFYQLIVLNILTQEHKSECCVRSTGEMRGRVSKWRDMSIPDKMGMATW